MADQPQRRDLRKLLAPRSIAVIGASDQPGNLGGTAIRLLQKFGYAGAVLPVNPKRESVLGLPCFSSVAAIPGGAELALITTGAATTPGLVRECAAAGIHHGVIWAGGFAETGAQGAALQRALAEACHATGFALAGPNCLGIVNTHDQMTATFSSALVEARNLIPGDISMVSQSGGLATMCHAMAQQAGFGFRLMISSGNEAVLTLADYVHALAEDPGTRVIAVYLEGVRDGTALLAAFGAARAAGKAVVVLKGGTTPASVAAVAAHTGALAGEGRVWEAVLREQGAVQVSGLEELVDTLLFLSASGGRMPGGHRVAVVTTGGGSGVVAADQCARQGLATPPPSEATLARLRALAPAIAALGNPIDLTPQVYTNADNFARFPAVLDAIASEPSWDSIYVQFGPMAIRGVEVAKEVAAFRSRAGKPVCVSWPLAPPGAVEALRDAGVPVIDAYARPIAMLSALARTGGGGAAPNGTTADFDWHTAVPRAVAGLVVSEHECHRILATAGLPVAAGRLASTTEDAVAAALAIGMPVALKGVSAAVTHRAAAGLVALDLRRAEEVAEADRLLRDRAVASGIALDGIYVQRMAKGGLELLVSAFRDAVFGPIVSLGAGGVLTETMDDVALARAPLDEAGALALLGRLRIMRDASKLAPGAEPAALARFVARISALAAAAPWRRFTLEVNPVKWSRDGVVAVDGLLIVEEP